ncbi:hypothetical protein ACLB2K_013202 [Fragaria x ananassa]
MAQARQQLPGGLASSSVAASLSFSGEGKKRKSVWTPTILLWAPSPAAAFGIPERKGRKKEREGRWEKREEGGSRGASRKEDAKEKGRERKSKEKKKRRERKIVQQSSPGRINFEARDREEHFLSCRRTPQLALEEIKKSKTRSTHVLSEDLGGLGLGLCWGHFTGLWTFCILSPHSRSVLNRNLGGLVVGSRNLDDVIELDVSAVLDVLGLRLDDDNSGRVDDEDLNLLGDVFSGLGCEGTGSADSPPVMPT